MLLKRLRERSAVVFLILCFRASISVEVTDRALRVLVEKPMILIIVRPRVHLGLVPSGRGVPWVNVLVIPLDALYRYILFIELL